MWKTLPIMAVSNAVTESVSGGGGEDKETFYQIGDSRAEILTRYHQNEYKI